MVRLKPGEPRFKEMITCWKAKTTKTQWTHLMANMYVGNHGVEAETSQNVEETGLVVGDLDGEVKDLSVHLRAWRLTYRCWLQ